MFNSRGNTLAFAAGCMSELVVRRAPRDIQLCLDNALDAATGRITGLMSRRPSRVVHVLVTPAASILERVGRGSLGIA